MTASDDTTLPERIIGSAALLSRPLLGLFCSSRCPGRAIIATYDLATAIAKQHQIGVVSGFHSPVEQECLRVLLCGVAPVVVCSALRQAGERLPKGFQEPMSAGRLTVVSGISQRTTRYSSAERNRTVAKLARVLFFAHINPGGLLQKIYHEATETAAKPAYGWHTDSPPQHPSIIMISPDNEGITQLLQAVAG